VSCGLFPGFPVFNRLWRREERCKDKRKKRARFGRLLADLFLAGKIRQIVLPWIFISWRWLVLKV
jgi:hypothetical protein